MKSRIVNRRRAPRARLALPVRIRCIDSRQRKEITMTSNVSREGLYFETSTRHYLEQYFYNWKVRVTRNFQVGDVINFEEPGQIVRIDRLPDGKLGIAIHLLSSVKALFPRVPGHSTVNG